MSKKKVFKAARVDETYYWDRIDRNIGIISREEQGILKNSTIGIAGCGGMGGLVAAQFARIGVGYLKIADCEVFDRSNINRQFGAMFDTVGKNKAVVTAQEIRRITPDLRIDVYDEGINEDSVEDFVKGCSVVCDEIELFAIKPRLMLHKTARSFGVPVFCCDVIGFGTRIFFFSPDSMTMEELLGLSGDEKIEPWIVRRLLERFAPESPNEFTEELIVSMFIGEKKAAIFGGTPLISSGILVDSVCLFLIGTDHRPWIVPVPKMPGYCLFDAGEWKTRVVRGKWW